MAFMPLDYPTMRAEFLDAAAATGAEIHAYPHPQPGPNGEAIATDVALIGSRTAARLLVINSGTHGVEGAYGSAAQVAWMRRHQPWHLPENTAVLMIHLINPWGVAWSRRVNEDNVDLNRNFLDWSRPAPQNPGYAPLHPALVYADLDGPDRARADAAYAEASAGAGGFAALAPTIEAGQYSHPDGLFYGGSGPVWSNQTLNRILSDFGAAAQDVIVFDLHTGAGPYAYPALLSVAVEEHAGLDWGRTLFGPAMSVVLTGEGRTTDTGIAATATGYVSDAVRKGMPQARVLPLVIECGTLPGEYVNNAVREDNWLHLHGAPLSSQGQAIKDTLRHAFVPADPGWQGQVLAASLAYFDRALADLEQLGGNAPRLAVAKPAAPAAPQSGRAAVEVHDLHKSYGALEVLKGVGLVAQPGEVVSMIGSSGSGKSTFLRCINLLEQPKSGRILIDGEEIRMKPDRDGLTVPADQKQVERIRARVGMVFQNFNLWPHLSVLDNIVEAPIHVLKESRAEAVDRAHELLKKVGLSEKHAHFPGQLSGGQQQRAAIARTLAMRPKVILLDEPTSALDPELVGEVLRVIRQLAEEGNTMILVTHEMQFAREVSHHIKFLHQGRVEEEGAPDQIFTNPRSERLSQFLARCN
ncbi:polar amino acid transport system ATP-binding protein [Paracoccus sulfuroxidans]|uniref:Polar amino acid transport system ATP-binding protein n=1 Tax=Paracoccus sulfuroxidans TaxID=384678 RepID=A0A562NPI4_9RHOB|nr:polar amino acid transport system ATP-binding protein [Paracoccus sulfuroxidans]